MTLLVGIAPLDGTGAVLLTDSLTLRFSDGGVEASRSTEGKLEILARSRLACIYSGVWDGAPFADLPASDFVTDARRVFRQRAHLRQDVPELIATAARSLDGVSAAAHSFALGVNQTTTHLWSVVGGYVFVFQFGN